MRNNKIFISSSSRRTVTVCRCSRLQYCGIHRPYSYRNPRRRKHLFRPKRNRNFAAQYACCLARTTQSVRSWCRRIPASRQPASDTKRKEQHSCVTFIFFFFLGKNEQTNVACIGTSTQTHCSYIFILPFLLYIVTSCDCVRFEVCEASVFSLSRLVMSSSSSSFAFIHPPDDGRDLCELQHSLLTAAWCSWRDEFIIIIMMKHMEYIRLRCDKRNAC